MLLGLRNESDKEGSSVFPSSTIRIKESSLASVQCRGAFAFRLARWKAQRLYPTHPRSKEVLQKHTHLLHGLGKFAFVTQLQLGDGQDRLNSLQFSVYVMNELRGEALFYNGQVLGHFQRQEEDDTHAAGQGQLGNLTQQGGSTCVSPLEPRSLEIGTHPQAAFSSPVTRPCHAFPAPHLCNSCPSKLIAFRQQGVYWCFFKK